MKNVVVLYNHNLSAGYLASEPLKDPTDMAGDFCTTHIMNCLKDPDHAVRQNAKERLDALQTTDGIQFHHFKEKKPYPKDRDFPSDSINPWIDRLEAFVAQKGESIDGLVIPYGKENSHAVTWIKELKERFPQIKILVTNCDLSALLPESEESAPGDEARQRASRYVVPETPEAVIDRGIVRATIKAGDAGYTLAEGVDAVTKNQKELVVSNLLRDLLGMERIREQPSVRSR